MDDYCASYKNIMLPKDKGKDMKTEALLHVSHVMWVCRPLCCDPVLSVPSALGLVRGALSVVTEK